MKEKIQVQRFLAHKTSQNFSVLFHRYTGALMRLAMYFTQYDSELSEDIVQETWMTAIEKLSAFTWQSSFKTWLTGILINKYRERIRQRKTWLDLDRVDVVDSNKSTQDLAMDLKNAILQLPDGYREILTLHDIEGFKHKEIALMLHISEGTSKSQLSRARKAMRVLLSDYKALQ